MSPLALCDDCPTQFDCVDDGCKRAKAMHQASPSIPRLAEVPRQSRNEILEEAALALEDASSDMLDELGPALIVRSLKK